MRCRDARSALHRAADGLASIEERLELDAHVAECERCAPLARRLEELELAFARLPEPPVESLDVETQVRAVRARLEQESVAARPTPASRSAWWLAAAAALALAAAGATLWSRRARPDAPPVVDGPRVPREERAPNDADASRGAHATDDAAATPSPDGANDASAPRTASDSDRARDTARDGATTPRAADGLAEAAPQPALPLDPDGERAPSSSAVGELAQADCDVPVAPSEAAELAHEPRADVDARPAPTPEELARADLARTELANTLANALATAPDERAPLRAAFERAVLPLERAQWPVVRLAEGLASAADAAVARPALRYLGLFGDKSSVHTLRRALDRDALANDAALALADLGEPALAALEELVVDPRREPLVLTRLAARGDDTSARCLEALVRRSVRDEPMLPSVHDENARRLRSRALLAVARSGPGAFAALLRLATDDVIPRSDALALARTTPGAAATLAEHLRTGLRSVDAELVLALVAELRPAGGIAWLDDRARSSRELRDVALTALADWDDAEAAHALLRWHASGRVPGERTRELFRGLGARHPSAVTALAAQLAARRERALVHELFELLVAPPAAGHVPALVELAATDLLVRGDRRTALQLVAELGAAEHVDALKKLWARLEPDERELRGACVLALYRLGGRDALTELFARAPARALDRLLAVCDDADASARPTTTLFRVLQELDSLGSRTTP
ncbi:MAG: zf-HC2 domain-containing protein [Planctomycetes bacterium]|nr:zf-HC2 domain-containing protein [Planctomycetota bacterium]